MKSGEKSPVSGRFTAVQGRRQVGEGRRRRDGSTGPNDGGRRDLWRRQLKLKGEEGDGNSDSGLLRVYGLVSPCSTQRRKRNSQILFRSKVKFSSIKIYDEEYHHRVIEAIVHHTSLENEATKHAVYGQWCLKSPNPANLYKLLHKASSRGFPGMLGSLDCMHWEWKNCPSSWARWAIVRCPARMWCKDNLQSIMMTCIILHNIIVEDEYEYVEDEFDDEDMCAQRSRRARARQYELKPSIMYEYHQDR
ncbi:hypothetical protein L3X38_010067 [Prunus dulcis]|uniref:Uncharacterized protein n=1 Tax=Prunus dulcis TaxID=3755 RepID=A0AAD4WH11_PRUDU|nr:hypothetical protein L3X38_010067 [Prunus dulcis]